MDRGKANELSARVFDARRTSSESCVEAHFACVVSRALVVLTRHARSAAAETCMVSEHGRLVRLAAAAAPAA